MDDCKTHVRDVNKRDRERERKKEREREREREKSDLLVKHRKHHCLEYTREERGLTAVSLVPFNHQSTTRRPLNPSHTAAPHLAVVSSR